MHYMVHAERGFSKEVVFHRSGLPKEGLLYLSHAVVVVSSSY